VRQFAGVRVADERHEAIASRIRFLPMQPPEGDPLEPLNALVGSWTIEATHPFFPSTLVGGQADFEWLEGKRFLLQHSRTDHPEFPDSLIVSAPTARSCRCTTSTPAASAASTA
jgi:hypothetical protein